MTTMKTVVAMMTACALLGGAAVAMADDKKPVASAGDVSAEVKAGTGVEKFEVVGEGTQFPAGSVVFVWSRITGGDGNIKHVWKRDGQEIWTATLPVGSKKWSTQSRRTMSKAGSYEVEVTTEGGASLGKVAFTIQ